MEFRHNIYDNAFMTCSWAGYLTLHLNVKWQLSISFILNELQSIFGMRSFLSGSLFLSYLQFFGFHDQHFFRIYNLSSQIWIFKMDWIKGWNTFFDSAIYRQMLKLCTVLRKMNLLFISLKLTNHNTKTDSQTKIWLCNT